MEDASLNEPELVKQLEERVRLEGDVMEESEEKQERKRSDIQDSPAPENQEMKTELTNLREENMRLRKRVTELKALLKTRD